MKWLRYLLTLLVLVAWLISVAAFAQDSSSRYLFVSAVAAASLAAIFAALSAFTPGRLAAPTFGLTTSFLLSGPPALAAIVSAAMVVDELDRNNCNPFRGCQWYIALDLHVSAFLFLLFSLALLFYALIVAALLIAGSIEAALRFSAGMASGYAALRAFLRSRYLKCSLVVAALIGWYAAVIVFELRLPARLPLAVSTALLLAVLLLALPAAVGRPDRSISELGSRFLLTVVPASAALIYVHFDRFKLDWPRADLFLRPRYDVYWLPVSVQVLWNLVIHVAAISLEFYAIIFFAFLFLVLIQKTEKLLERKVE